MKQKPYYTFYYWGAFVRGAFVRGLMSGGLLTPWRSVLLVEETKVSGENH